MHLFELSSKKKVGHCPHGDSDKSVCGDTS